MKNTMSKFLVLTAGLVLVISFQNCSDNYNVGSTGGPSKATGAQPVSDDSDSTPAPPSCRDIKKKDVSSETGVSLVACNEGSDAKCALVCHVPPGNPNAKHNIVVGLAARNGPHRPGGHGGDYDGPCSDQAPVFEACDE